METRKITIISTRANKKYVIETAATTLGQLKAALRNEGVDFQDMTFYEGLTKTELNHDSSVLPHDVKRVNPDTQQLETTNELVFMITNSNKKIKSGARSRKDVFELIKDNNLQGAVIEKFGKNYTNCRTYELEEIIEDYPNGTKYDGESEDNSEYTDSKARKAIDMLLNVLVENHCISMDDEFKVHSIIDKKDTSSPYTDKEIDNMFDFIS